MLAGIIIGLLLIVTVVSIMISYYYHQLAKGLLAFNNKINKRKTELEKESSDYVIAYYREKGKKNRLYKLLKQIRAEYQFELRDNKLLRAANEQLWVERYHAGFLVGFNASEQRLIRKDLSNIKLGKDGFVKGDK